LNPARRLRAFVVLSLAGHAALLSAVVLPGPSRDAPSVATVAPRGVQWRALPAATEPAVGAATAEPAPAPARLSRRPAAEAANPGAGAMRTDAAPVPAPAVEEAIVAPAPKPAMHTTTHAIDASPSAPLEPGAFLPRSLLSVGPTALDEVRLPWPDGVTLDGAIGLHLTGTLALFIDETGAVRDVQAEDDSLPAEFIGVARSAFLSARFRPGERDGRPVRSRLRVEVAFEARDAGTAW
jgi:hypothetical protein